jgi:hypothetical protein
VDDLADLWRKIMSTCFGGVPDVEKANYVFNNADSLERTRSAVMDKGGDAARVSDADWARWWEGSQQAKSRFGPSVYPESFWKELRGYYRAEIIEQGERSQRFLCDSECIILGLLNTPPVAVVSVPDLKDVANGNMVRTAADQRFIVNRSRVHWEVVLI